MITAYPEYFKSFSCLASECRHTCCAGWEIDVDSRSYERYTSYPDILEKIVFEDGLAQFQCCDDGRCPFLEDNGLCSMIIRYGEEMLCDICTDHPRFRNFFPDRTEIGLGLCCESAAQLILSYRDPVRIIERSDGKNCDSADDDEVFILNCRNELFGILQDRSIPVMQRLDAVQDAFQCEMIPYSGEEVYELLLSLERLDPAWEQMIQPLRLLRSMNDTLVPNEAETALEQLSVYFFWRHIAPAWEDDALTERILLCVFLTRLSAALILANGKYDQAEACEIMRMLSAEIEYSDENLQNIIDRMCE